MKPIFPAVALALLASSLGASAAISTIADYITGSGPITGAPVAQELATRFGVPFGGGSVRPLQAEFKLIGTAPAGSVTARIYTADPGGNLPVAELLSTTLPRRST
jgi:hypothetical protein